MGLNEDYLDNLLESMEEEQSDETSLEEERESPEEDQEEDIDTKKKGETSKAEVDESDDDMEFLELAKLFEDDLGEGPGPSGRRQRMVAVEEDPELEKLPEEEEFSQTEASDEADLDSLMSEDPFEELDMSDDGEIDMIDDPEMETDTAVSSAVSSGRYKEETEEAASGKKKKDRKKKGPGLIQRIIAFFTGSDEEEDEEGGSDRREISLSRENSEVLDELDAERAAAGKKEKRPKKEKKPKKAKAKSAKKPKPKKAKPSKPKKVKPPQKPLKPIGMRRIMVSVFLGLTVFGMIMLFTIYIPDLMDRRKSELAFGKGDYKEAYELLVTKDLKGKEEQIYRGSLLCLQMERKLESYENYKKIGGMEEEQLHALISGVARYWNIEAEAERFQVSAPVKNSYLDILGILQTQYGVSEDEARELSKIADAVAYTKALRNILYPELGTSETVAEDMAGESSYEEENSGRELSNVDEGLPEEADFEFPENTDGETTGPVGFEPPENTGFEMPDNTTPELSGDAAEGDL